MKIIAGICVLWVVFIFCVEIKANKIRGTILVILTSTSVILYSSGTRFGFDGENATIALIVFFAIGNFMFELLKKRRNKDQRQVERKNN